MADREKGKGKRPLFGSSRLKFFLQPLQTLLSIHPLMSAGGNELFSRGDGAFHVTFLFQQNAEVVVGIGVIRVNLEGAAVRGLGARLVAVALQQIAEVVVGTGVIRVNLEGAAVIFGGYWIYDERRST